jgi:ribosomal protein L29
VRDLTDEELEAEIAALTVEEERLREVIASNQANANGHQASRRRRT